ncbi:MAG TPA: ABC transporter permease [Gaiellales bacterium]|nr:ABC transporter permease [Gaiellales bacterium]
MAASTSTASTGALFTTRSAVSSSRIAFAALLLRDLVVLRKRLREFIPRTIIQPLLLCFVFLYVFPTIGTGVGGGHGAAGESEFATILVAGVVGLSIMFQGIQAVALPLVQEFGYTREIEDRVLAPLPVSLVALEKVIFGAIQGLFAAVLVFPIAAVVHSSQIHVHLQVHWFVLVTLMPLACIVCSSLGLTFGTIFDPRTVPLLFGIIILPLTFLGGTYYSWTALAPVTVGSLHWLQWIVLVNPLIYMNEGFRAALTSSNHMSLWAVYPALLGFAALFLFVGIRNFKRRVIG